MNVFAVFYPLFMLYPWYKFWRIVTYWKSDIWCCSV